MLYFLILLRYLFIYFQWTHRTWPERTAVKPTLQWSHWRSTVWQTGWLAGNKETGTPYLICALCKSLVKAPHASVCWCCWWGFFYTEGGAKKSEPCQSYCTWKHWHGAMSDFGRQMERVGREARREGESSEPGNQRALGWNLVAAWVVWVSSVHVGFTARLSFRGRAIFIVWFVGWGVVCEHGLPCVQTARHYSVTRSLKRKTIPCCRLIRVAFSFDFQLGGGKDMNAHLSLKRSNWHMRTRKRVARFLSGSIWGRNPKDGCPTHFPVLKMRIGQVLRRRYGIGSVFVCLF